ncbi:MAG: TRAP transporter substrate-binding protein [Thiothrix sp.]|nr:TRAP transporter substrate-binding protein [Thiothrix sp.]HPE59836.1 TRAP transporter substrate-binding protein [Thiolinea sp.]
MLNLKKLSLLAACSLALGFSTASFAGTYKMGMVTPPSHIWNKVAERFDANLQEATGKKDKIKVFPLGKLGGDDQMIDLLQSGGLQLAIITAGTLSNREASMYGWFMPYLFEDVTAAAAATKSDAAQKMLADLQQHKMIGLGYAQAGMRHVISAKPIATLDDFKDKKIRAFPNKIFNDWWGGLGAAPTALPIADVSSALTTNLLDAVDVDLDIVVGLKMYQQAPNLTLTNHMAFPGVIVASEKWWSGLSAEEQETIRKALGDAETWGFEEQAKAELSNLELLKEAGVTVHPFDIEALQAVAQKITDTYTAGNADIKDFVEQVKGTE